jgi:hypothetical protein
MDMNAIVAILATVIVLLAGSVLAYKFYSRQRTKRLKGEFGPEYDRVMEEAGSRREAEEALENLQEQFQSLNIRALDSDEWDHFLKKWNQIQADFAGNLEDKVNEADLLITEVMLVRGYPLTQLDPRAEDLSVDYPGVVSQYRHAHAIAMKNRYSQAGSEELRQALIRYRMLFQELLELHVLDEEPETADVMLA